MLSIDPITTSINTDILVRREFRRQQTKSLIFTYILCYYGRCLNTNQTRYKIKGQSTKYNYKTNKVSTCLSIYHLVIIDKYGHNMSSM